MRTYTTLEGHVLDLSDLTEEQQQFLDRCMTAYQDGMTWTLYCRLIEGLDNPLLRPTDGVVTWAVWNPPLFQAVTDIEGRLGVQQDELLAEPGDDVARDPLADEWLPVEEAARRKRVTRRRGCGAASRPAA